MRSWTGRFSVRTSGSGSGSERRLGAAGYAIVAAALALVSSLVSIVFTLWPELRPDPRERLSAEVSVFDVEPAVTYGAWLRRTSASTVEYRKREEAYIGRAGIPGEPVDITTRRRLLRVQGNVVYVRVTIEGFKRRSVGMRWSMYDARSHRRVPQGDFQDVRAGDVDLDAPSDRIVVQLWVPLAPVEQDVFLRIELLSRAGALLAVGDSERFRGFGREAATSG
jgi:hypothetical protein